jgi:hypothetical protein
MERPKDIHELNRLKRKEKKLSRCMTDNRCMTGECCKPSGNPTICHKELLAMRFDIDTYGEDIITEPRSPVGEYTWRSSKDISDRNDLE